MIFQQIIESATPDISFKVALALAHYVGCITQRPNGLAWCLTQYNGHRLDHSIVHKPQKITRSPSFCNFPSPNMHLCRLCSIWDVSVTLFLCSFQLTVGVQSVFLFPLKLLLSWVGKAEGLIVSMIFKVTIMVPKIIFPVPTFATLDAALTKVQPKKDNIIFWTKLNFI